MLLNAHDENDDDLLCAVYYRGENERDWKLLKDKVDQNAYSRDTTPFADGAYYLKDRGQRLFRRIRPPPRLPGSASASGLKRTILRR